MARKTRTEQFETVKSRLESARRWRDDQGYDALWTRMVDLYRGKHWPRTTYGKEDLVVVNLAFSTINVIAPSISVNHPKVVVSPNNPEDQDRAAFVEAVVNHMWRHHDYQTPFKRAVKDFLIFGHGWVKVGWKFLEQERMLAEAERSEMLAEARGEVDAFARMNPLMAAELPTETDIAASLPETTLTVVEDQPFVERVSPYDVFVDPEATSLDDARWIAQRIIRPLDEAQRDKRYKPSARKRLDADASTGTGYSNKDDVEQYLFDEERVVIYEFYDMTENTMSVCSQSGDEFLVDPVAMPYAYGQPFVMLRNYDVPDEFYPMGDLEAIQSLQEELDKTRTQLVNARKRYARKYLYHERSFGPEGREALESDEDGRLVPVVDENKPLSEVIIPMPQIPLSADVYNVSAIIEQDINMVSGVSEYARGQMPEIRRTATEASIIADAGNARAADKLAIIELALSHIARRVVQVMQQYMTGEQMARIATTGGENLFITYTRDDITGEYDFAIEAGSTQPMNDTIRKNQAVNLLNAMAPLVGTVINPAELAKHVLQQGFDIKDPEKFIIQQQPQLPAGPEQGMPTGGPQMGQMGMPEAPPETNSGITPEILAQLQGQMGLDLANL